MGGVFSGQGGWKRRGELLVLAEDVVDRSFYALAVHLSKNVDVIHDFLQLGTNVCIVGALLSTRREELELLKEILAEPVELFDD